MIRDSREDDVSTQPTAVPIRTEWDGLNFAEAEGGAHVLGRLACAHHPNATGANPLRGARHA